MIKSDEEKRMAEVLHHAEQQGFRKPSGRQRVEHAPPRVQYTRPEGVVHWCMRTAWKEDPELTRMERAAPDTWENIRFRLEQHLKLHDSSPHRGTASFIVARIVNDFETRDIKRFPELKDDEIVDEDSVIIVFRRPSTNRIGHYVPLACLQEWERWIDSKLRTKELRKASSKRTHFNSERRDFFTSTHTWGKYGWFPRKQRHASNYVDKPPPFRRCENCDEPGDHWEADCQAKARTAKRKLRMIHGIPRSQLRKVDPDSEEGRKATLTDLEGNLYVDRMTSGLESTGSKVEAIAFLDRIGREISNKRRRT